MSRLLKSLEDAKRQRPVDSQSSGPADAQESYPNATKPTLLWVGITVFVLVCVLILGAFLLL